MLSVFIYAHKWYANQVQKLRVHLGSQHDKLAGCRQNQVSRVHFEQRIQLTYVSNVNETCCKM